MDFQVPNDLVKHNDQLNVNTALYSTHPPITTSTARLRERLTDLRNAIRNQLVVSFNLWIAIQSHSSPFESRLRNQFWSTVFLENGMSIL